MKIRNPPGAQFEILVDGSRAPIATSGDDGGRKSPEHLARAGLRAHYRLGGLYFGT